MEIRNKKGETVIQLCPNQYIPTLTQFKGGKAYVECHCCNHCYQAIITLILQVQVLSVGPIFENSS